MSARPHLYLFACMYLYAFWQSFKMLRRGQFPVTRDPWAKHTIIWAAFVELMLSMWCVAALINGAQ